MATVFCDANFRRGEHWMLKEGFLRTFERLLFECCSNVVRMLFECRSNVVRMLLKCCSNEDFISR
jgi:hypothetical protein